MSESELEAMDRKIEDADEEVDRNVEIGIKSSPADERLKHARKSVQFKDGSDNVCRYCGQDTAANAVLTGYWDDLDNFGMWIESILNEPEPVFTFSGNQFNSSTDNDGCEDGVMFEVDECEVVEERKPESSPRKKFNLNEMKEMITESTKALLEDAITLMRKKRRDIMSKGPFDLGPVYLLDHVIEKAEFMIRSDNPYSMTGLAPLEDIGRYDGCFWYKDVADLDIQDFEVDTWGQVEKARAQAKLDLIRKERTEMGLKNKGEKEEGGMRIEIDVFREIEKLRDQYCIEVNK
jgi:hypothetical protein